MKIDIISPPPPLAFGEGDDEFKLHLKRFTAEDRAAVIDALLTKTDVFSQVTKAVERVVETWSGVCDPNGHPIAMKIEDDDGNVTNQLGKFLGAVPPLLQWQVLLGVLGFMGIDTAAVSDLSAIFKDAKGPPNADPTEPPAGSTPTSASGGSSSTETPRSGRHSPSNG